MNILTDPWNVVFFVGFLAYLRIRGVYAHRTKTEEKAHRQIDRLEKTLLIAVISSSVLLPMLYLFTPLLNFADYDLPAVVRWLGAAIMLAALWLFWRSHADLGQNWSVSLEIRKGHQLVRHGVYRLIRHPMYGDLVVEHRSGAIVGKLVSRLVGGCAVRGDVLLAHAARGTHAVRVPWARLPRLHETNWKTVSAAQKIRRRRHRTTLAISAADANRAMDVGSGTMR
jgi:protein-S-isoprenylcysteine O-methyltransferase Ste14